MPDVLAAARLAPGAQRSGTPTGAATVAYVVSRWGEPTQTFVRREAAAVAAAGGDVEVLSLKRPQPTDLAVTVTFLPAWRVVLSALAAMIRRPRPTLRALWLVTTMSSLRNVAPQTWACLVGFAWAGRGRANADLLHAHFGWVTATAAWSAARISGGPYSVVLHAFELHTTSRVDRFTPLPLRDAATVSTISHGDAELVRRRWGIEPTVLRMGVDEEWLAAPVRAEERDPWLLVSVGSLVPKKGHEVLLEALTGSDPRWRLIIVGDGPRRASLTSAIDRLGLAGRVELGGLRSEASVRDLVRRAEGFVLASVIAPGGDHDGIPVALMEAMAAATPVVTTTVGAIEELVDGDGIVVAPSDPVGLAAAIDRLRDRALRSSLGARGRARVEREFSSAAAGAAVLATARSYTGSVV